MILLELAYQINSMQIFDWNNCCLQLIDVILRLLEK